MVGDAEEIDKVKVSMIKEVNMKRTKCFQVRVEASTTNVDEDVCSRARALTLFSCQEASRALKGKVISPVGWYYISKKKHLTDLADEIKGRIGSIVIWIDLGNDDCTALDLENWLEETISGQLHVVYVVSRDVEAIGDDSNSIINPILKHHGLRKSEKRHFETIDIQAPKTNIDLSHRESCVNLTVRGIPTDISPTKLSSLLQIMSAEFFDEKDGLLPLQRREVFFYMGDDQCGHVCICVRNIKQLNRMFSSIFFPENRKRLIKKLNNIDANARFEFQMSNALKFFQQIVLELDTLTNDQKEKLDKIRILRRVLINGRAGTGKTFVALHEMLKLLALRRNVQSPEVIILVCSDYLSLGNDMVKWLRVRLGGSIEEVNLQLQKIHFLFRSEDDSGMCQLQICKTGNEEEVVQSPVPDEKEKYELIVVDEGHHVFAKRKLSEHLPLFNEVKEIVRVSREKVKDIREYSHLSIHTYV
jgi:hypothetical protein